jgi:NADPH-dependent glutamate synthase beta subunit-like oxidoreductase
MSLDVPGRDLDGVISGIDFLLNANLGYKVDLGRKVVVIGGGNVAIDVARTVRRIGEDPELRRFGAVSEAREHIEAALDMARSALRMGARDVTMVCLESRENMPAWEWEIEEGLHEGVKLLSSLGPKAILGEGGKVTGLETLAVRSVLDADGRFNPSFHQGSERVIETDTVVLAIGQAPDVSWIREEDGIEITPRGLVQVERNSLATTAPGVYGGGDLAFGPRLIIEAVADGQRAARSIAKYLREEIRIRRSWRSTEIEHRMAADFDRTPRQKPPVIDVDRRTGISEVEVCYVEAQARTEGSRCYRCDVNTIVSSTLCILCGGCADVCPESCYRLVDVRQIRGDERIREIIQARFDTDPPPASAILKDEERCTRCGLCARRCPTGAITMERYEEEEVVA